MLGALTCPQYPNVLSLEASWDFLPHIRTSLAIKALEICASQKELDRLTPPLHPVITTSKINFRETALPTQHKLHSIIVMNTFLIMFLSTIVVVLFPHYVSGLSPVSTADKNSQVAEPGDAEKGNVYKVVGPAAGGPQYLPASYVKTFSRWQISGTGSLVPAVTTEECTADESQEKDDTIRIQPTINFLLKGGGVPAYLFAGLWVGTGTNNNGQSQSPEIMISGDNNHHYLAQQWTTFDVAVHPNFRMEIFLGLGDGVDDKRLGVVDAQEIKEAVEQLGTALASSQEEDLSGGFHIVSIPLKIMVDMSDLDMARGKGGTMMLTCVATAESNALQLLSLDEKAFEQQTATSKLVVEAFKVLSAVVA